MRLRQDSGGRWGQLGPPAPGGGPVWPLLSWARRPSPRLASVRRGARTPWGAGLGLRGAKFCVSFQENGHVLAQATPWWVGPVIFCGDIYCSIAIYVL